MKYTLIFSHGQINALVIDLFLRGPYGGYPLIYIVENRLSQMYLDASFLSKLEEKGYANALNKNFLPEYKQEAERVAKLLDTWLTRQAEVYSLTHESFVPVFQEFVKDFLEFLEPYTLTEFFHFGLLEKKLIQWITEHHPANIPQTLNSMLAGTLLTDTPADIKQIIEFTNEIGKTRWFLRDKINQLYFGDSIFKGFHTSFQRLTGRKDFALLRVDEIEKVISGEEVPDVSNRIQALVVKKGIKEWEFLTGPETQLTIRQLKESTITSGATEISGRMASPGKAMGIARVYSFGLDHSFSNFQKGDILVASATGPEYMTAIQRAGGIVADEGGLISHAAIVSREMKIPCVIGTRTGSLVIKDGDLVELDADKETVRIIERHND